MVFLCMNMSLHLADSRRMAQKLCATVHNNRGTEGGFAMDGIKVVQMHMIKCGPLLRDHCRVACCPQVEGGCCKSKAQGGAVWSSVPRCASFRPGACAPRRSVWGPGVRHQAINMTPGGGTQANRRKGSTTTLAGAIVAKLRNCAKQGAFEGRRGLLRVTQGYKIWFFGLHVPNMGGGRGGRTQSK